MAVLETIRNKFGILITVLIAVALLSFIVDPSTLFTSNNGEPVNNDITVAEINGYDVSYYDFHNAVQLHPSNKYPMLDSKIYRNYVHNQVMKDFISEYLYAQNAKDAGFNVDDKELAMLLSGDIYSEMVYVAMQGNVSHERLEELESNAQSDPADKARWDNFLNQVKNGRYIDKYNTYLINSSFETPLLAENTINNSNNLFDVEFVMVPFGSAVDSTIVVSDTEIADYYKSHMDRFVCPAFRDVEYILVEIDSEDETGMTERVDSVFSTIYDFETFTKAAIDNQYANLSTRLIKSSNTLQSVSNTESVTKWAFTESQGSISPIFNITDNDKSYMAIAYLANVDDTGYMPLNEMTESIRYELSVEKAVDKTLAEVTAKVNGLSDLEAIAAALGTEVSTKENMTFASNDFDQKFIGAVSVADKDVLSTPFKGSNGVYIYKVIGNSVGAFYTDADAKNTKTMYDNTYMGLYNYYLSQYINYEQTFNYYMNNLYSAEPVEITPDMEQFLRNYIPYDNPYTPNLVKDYTPLYNI